MDAIFARVYQAVSGHGRRLRSRISAAKRERGETVPGRFLRSNAFMVAAGGFVLAERMLHEGEMKMINRGGKINASCGYFARV